MEYTKHIDNYIKKNPIPIILKCKLNHLQDEKNIYNTWVYKENLQVSKHPGNESIYLN
jgi:hypothetical protein